MVKISRGEQDRYSVVEVIIALGLLVALLVTVVPNMGDFIGRGKKQAYEADKSNLQAAVDGYYNDSSRQPEMRRYPTGDGTGGAPGTSTYIYFDRLVDGGYLEKVPQSASKDNPGHRSSPGSYSWYVDTDGKVDSVPAFKEGMYP